MRQVERAWLAGILEGEGHFSIQRVTDTKFYPGLEMKMVDLDVVQKVADLIGGVSVQRRPAEKVGWQDQYRVRVRGARAVQVMREIYPMMSERRRGQIDTVLSR